MLERQSSMKRSLEMVGCTSSEKGRASSASCSYFLLSTNSQMCAEASLHSKRRRRTYSEEESLLSGWKLGVLIAVIIMCFAMLYPSMFHPLVTSLFIRTPTTQKTFSIRPPVHPAMSMNSPRSRPNIHPGMRMAGSQPESNTPSSSKGIFAWMLPIYTIGVAAFLIYTLLKSKKRQNRRLNYSSSETESDEDCGQVERRRSGSAISKRKLKELQERLRQTEMAMEKILEQLNTVPNETSNFAKENLITEGKSEEMTRQTLSQQNEKTEQYLCDLEKALHDFKQLSKNYKKQGKNENPDVSDAELDYDGCIGKTLDINNEHFTTAQKHNSLNEHTEMRNTNGSVVQEFWSKAETC